MKLKEGAKIAILARAGPANGPYSAQCVATLKEGFRLNKVNVNFAGYYSVSGACPTSLLSCIDEEKMLCDIWSSLTPQEVVGDREELDHLTHFLGKFKDLPSAPISHLLEIRLSDIRDLKAGSKVIRRLKEGHIFSRMSLTRLIWKYIQPYLDKIFSPEAAIMKIGAVDYLTGQQIIFSNKVPEHKDLLHLGVVASMCLVPIFDSLTIDKPRELKLVDRTHPQFDSLLLVDGGYRAPLLLEEAIREPIGYDAMFIIDINGVEYKPIEPEMVGRKYNLVSRIEGVQSIASLTNDRLQLSLKDRIDEEIAIKEKGIAIRKKLIEARKMSSRPEDINDAIKEVNDLVAQMDNGRLRLADKHAIEAMIISSPGYHTHFDFTNFTQAEMAQLRRHGHHDTLKTLKQLGLSTKGLPLIWPQ